jgi:alpha-tubulin suppressor-like RCC1 family protein
MSELALRLPWLTVWLAALAAGAACALQVNPNPVGVSASGGPGGGIGAGGMSAACHTDAECAALDSACTHGVCDPMKHACQAAPVVECKSGDGCCPDGCGKTTDSDCLTDNAIASGGNHTCLVNPQGSVFCFGWGSEGQVGDAKFMTPEPSPATATLAKTPVAVKGLVAGAVAIAAGGRHSCAITSGGALYCWGRNQEGELGNGTTTSTAQPTQVVGLPKGVVAVAAGGFFTCAVVEGGALYCWGQNNHGQLGDGTQETRLTPVPVVGLTQGVTALGAGNYHTCAIVSGVAKCWGKNSHGQVGDGTTLDRSTPSDKGVPGMAAVAPGDDHTCGLTPGGGAECWGSNGKGQLGDGSNSNTFPLHVDVYGLSSGVVGIASGDRYSCALLATGGVQCWGTNGVSQISDGKCSGLPPYVAKPADIYDFSVMGSLKGAVALSPGVGDHRCIATDGGRFMCWGANYEAQLGVGNNIVHGCSANQVAYP